MKIKRYKEFTNESLFGLFKKEDDDVADKLIKFIQNNSNLDINFSNNANDAHKDERFEFDWTINNESVSVKIIKISRTEATFSDTSMPVVRSYYKLYIDNIQLKCSDSKMKKIFKLIEKILIEQDKKELEKDLEEQKKRKDDLRWFVR